MTPDDPNNQDQNLHFRTLGICWVLYGTVRLLAAAWLVSFSNTATLMFGALLARVPDPFTMMSVFHFLYTFVVVLSVACGVLGFLAGLALLAGRGSGRALTLGAAFLSLSEIPLGVTLGIYSLIVFLRMPARVASTNVRLSRASDFTSHPSAT